MQLLRRTPCQYQPLPRLNETLESEKAAVIQPTRAQKFYIEHMCSSKKEPTENEDGPSGRRVKGCWATSKRTRSRLTARCCDGVKQVDGSCDYQESVRSIQMRGCLN